MKSILSLRAAMLALASCIVAFQAAKAAPEDYEFQLVDSELKQGDAAVLAVRLVDKRSGALAGLQRACAAMQARGDAAWDERDPATPLASPYEALILASIVEKETGRPADRPLIASVFVNRLKRGMRLQTDPTVIYGITKGQGVLGRGLRQSELRGRTPYNTYVIDGLPPTPIANPGRESIAAALKPETTDYLFFVADGTGGHVFATTLAEHNDNVAKWRASEAQQQEQGTSGN